MRILRATSAKRTVWHDRVGNVPWMYMREELPADRYAEARLYLATAKRKHLTDEEIGELQDKGVEI